MEVLCGAVRVELRGVRVKVLRWREVFIQQYSGSST